jgi:MADS-box transcription factor
MLFRTLIGDSNIATMSHKDLKQLEARLDKGLVKIRARKVQRDTHTYVALL